MKYREEQGNLFELGPDYWYCQCISSDFGMGAGIATQFNKFFDQKNRIMQLHPEYETTFSKYRSILRTYGDCLVDEEKHIFNLVTKEKYWQKPTDESLYMALTKAKDYIIDSKGTNNEITKIAMPKIGCGLDRLDWLYSTYSRTRI